MSHFRTNLWPDVAEAIEDNLAPGPEQEFLTNSIEYLDAGNLRSALIESIVCLEIVTSQFLRNYLEKAKQFSKKKISRILPIQVGLTSRIGLLLDLVLSAAERERAHLDEILIAINWRNGIIHETGRLPDAVDESQVKERIYRVLDLALMLARKRDQLAGLPETIAMANEIATTWTLPVPTMTDHGRHRWSVNFQMPLFEDFPNQQRMRDICIDIGARLAVKDVRFRANDHLYVRFSQVQKTIAEWRAGELRQLTTPLERLVPPPPPPLAVAETEGHR